MRLVVVADPDALAEAAAELLRDRLVSQPDLAMAVPAGRTPRRMYARLRELQALAPVDYARMRVFAIVWGPCRGPPMFHVPNPQYLVGLTPRAPTSMVSQV